jgi:acylpyruvate hydrolase
MGYNYRDHTANAGDLLPDYPTLFAKCTSAVIGPHQPIVIPRVSSQVDYEAELAFVIGKRARHIAEEQALEFVAGYTILNDVSARDHIKRSSQWMMGKSFDTFAPLGPALVTRDEVPDPGHLDLYLTLNGQELQHSNTRHLIFSIPYLIAYISQAITLEPGDIVSTGTPWGTGITREPPIFIKPGDVVRICVERIGELVNPVVAEA